MYLKFTHLILSLAVRRSQCILVKDRGRGLVSDFYTQYRVNRKIIKRHMALKGDCIFLTNILRLIARLDLNSTV